MVCLILLAAATAGSLDGQQEMPADLRPFVSVMYPCDDGASYWTVGSGTIITPEGLVLTNEHVFNATDEACDTNVVYIGYDRDRDRHTPPEPTFRATKLAYWFSGFPGEPAYDVAAMQITHSAAGTPLSDPSFPYVRLGNPFDLPDGAEILMLGFPSVGGRNLTPTVGTFANYLEASPPFADGAININGSVWPGNSGGSALYKDPASQFGDQSPWRLIGVPTMRGEDQAVVHPITWAAPLFRYLERRLGVDAPEIRTEWVRSVRNRDVWTRERSTLMGFVTNGDGQPIAGARVWAFPEELSLSVVKSHFEEVDRVPYVDVHDDEIYFGVAETDQSGFFETWIDDEAKFELVVEKAGYESHSSNWTPATALTQSFEEAFVLDAQVSTNTFEFGECMVWLRASTPSYENAFALRSAGRVSGLATVISRPLAGKVRIRWVESDGGLRWQTGWVLRSALPRVSSCPLLD